MSNADNGCAKGHGLQFLILGLGLTVLCFKERPGSPGRNPIIQLITLKGDYTCNFSRLQSASGLRYLFSSAVFTSMAWAACHWWVRTNRGMHRLRVKCSSEAIWSHQRSEDIPGLRNPRCSIG